MLTKEVGKNTEVPPPLKGGPLGYGDPNDKRLRKTERDIIIPKMIRQEAKNRCSETVKMFVNCAKETGLFVALRCKEENKANNDCIASWSKNPEFVKEVTDKYLEQRSHFRRTGEPLERYSRKKSSNPSMC